MWLLVAAGVVVALALRRGGPSESATPTTSAPALPGHRGRWDAGIQYHEGESVDYEGKVYRWTYLSPSQKGTHPGQWGWKEVAQGCLHIGESFPTPAVQRLLDAERRGR